MRRPVTTRDLLCHLRGSLFALIASLSVCPVLLCSGCSQSEAVVTRTVPKKDRTLVAYIPNEDAVWFVKLSGPTAFVDPLEDDFRQILDGISFDDKGELTAKLPEGWSKQPAKSMRFATYAKDDMMEVAVTRLSANDPLDNTYVSLNINRWLRELGQPPRKGDWKQETEKRNELEQITVAGKDAMLFDLRGNVVPIRSATIITADPYLNYTVPDSWIEKPGDNFRLAIFEIPDGAEASISQAGGNPVDNINRWEQQLGQTPSTGDQLREKLETVSIAEQPGLLIRIDGERTEDGSDKPTPATTIGVITASEDSQYFIKLIGPKDAVDAAEADFRQFLTTISF